MKINISSKNYPMSEKLSNYIEKKLDKIGKYFDEDTTANIVVSIVILAIGLMLPKGTGPNGTGHFGNFCNFWGRGST